VRYGLWDYTGTYIFDGRNEVATAVSSGPSANMMH